MSISMKKLKEIMEERGIKKFDLRKAGFNPNILDKVLSGNLNKQKRVDTETINKICKYFSIQPGDFMEYFEDEWFLNFDVIVVYILFQGYTILIFFLMNIGIEKLHHQSKKI